MNKDLFPLLIVLLLLGGCARPHLQADLPQITGAKSSFRDKAVIVSTPHYRVEAFSSKQTADDIGILMETTYRACSEMLGTGRQHEALSVYAYTDRSVYEQQLHLKAMESSVTTGFYTPQQPSGIYLPLQKTNHAHPFFTLVHEGVHQYLHEVHGLTVPGTSIRLPMAPSWLSEGLALFLEAALVNIKLISPGRLHAPRLEHLKQRLRNKPAPDLDALFSKTYGTLFTNEDYSISWGIIYFLYQNNEWGNFLEKWFKAVAMEGENFLANSSLDDEERYHELQLSWAEALSRLSLQFTRNVLGGGTRDLSTWQRRWQESLESTEKHANSGR